MSDNEDSEDCDFQDDDDDGGFESIQTEAAPYVVMSTTEAAEKQQSEINQVKELLEISAAFASILLRFFKWNMESLLTCYFDKGRMEVFKAAGVLDVQQSSSSRTSRVFCSCCMEEIEWVDTSSLNCGHRFCNECWTCYVSSKLTMGRPDKMTCMEKGCNVVLDDSRIPNHISGALLEKYHKLLMDSYVASNPLLTWCTSVPHCGYLIALTQSFPRSIIIATCICGHDFCLKCSEEPHPPATCAIAKTWKNKLEAESENTKWLASNTKDCPACGKPVEKDGGCNLMSCRCGAYFCWICGGQTGSNHTWHNIEGHTCGKYKENFVADLAKTELQRYQHYFSRFQANKDSRRMEERLHTELKMRTEKLHKISSELSTDWLPQGILALRRCRSMLQWSYVWAFYALDKSGSTQFALKQSVQEGAKNIFEDSQEQLERLTERLSKALETQINNHEEFMKVQREVLDLSAVAKRRREGLLNVLEIEILKEEYVEFLGTI